jgi:hypothetical protein
VSALDESCEYCGAKPGKPCRTIAHNRTRTRPVGSVVKEPHVARRRSAASARIAQLRKRQQVEL